MIDVQLGFALPACDSIYPVYSSLTEPDSRGAVYRNFIVRRVGAAII
jgi:hypothetical protein